MRMRLLNWILEQEAGSFQRLERRWRPIGLLPEPYRRVMLKDIQKKSLQMDAALDEFASLDRGDVYTRLILRMRQAVQKAKIAWRFDDLAFLQAIEKVYTDYGTIMRLLATDKARGRLEPLVKKEG